MTNPEHDQLRARVTDLSRLRDLLAPHSAGGGAPISITISRMPPADRAEAEAILARNPDLGEPREKTAARRDMLLDIAGWEATAQAIHDDPTTSDVLRRHAAATLAEIGRLRSALTGLPDLGDSDDGAH
jgi:hypothetical protein